MKLCISIANDMYRFENVMLMARLMTRPPSQTCPPQWNGTCLLCLSDGQVANKPESHVLLAYSN